MNRIRKKLCGKAGESLVETLCAILIFALTSAGLYTMVVTAGNINAAARETERSFQEQLSIVERAEGPGEAGTVTITIRTAEGNTHTAAIPVRVYRAGELHTYFTAEAGGGE